jgi:hypothetical protein
MNGSSSNNTTNSRVDKQVQACLLLQEAGARLADASQLMKENTDILIDTNADDDDLPSEEEKAYDTMANVIGLFVQRIGASIFKQAKCLRPPADDDVCTIFSNFLGFKRTALF